MDTSKILRNIIFVLVFPLLLWGCGQVTDVRDNPNTIPNLNQGNQVEIVTWNLEQFPLQGATTVDSARKIMQALDADIYCLQEIQNVANLKSLVNSLDNYAVTYSQYTDFMRLAIVYRTTDLLLRDTTEIFIQNDYPFAGRPPLRADFTFRWSGNKEFDFSVIDLHMKCCGGSENIDRRREAAEMLHTYLDSVQFAGQDTNLVVVGDWNNDLDNMSENHPYRIFWADSDQYQFLTYGLAGESSDYYDSYPGWPSFLDHILVSKALFNEAAGGQVQTLRIGDYMNNYLTLVSDHRPVAWAFTP